MDYDRYYAETADVFGSEPEQTLRSFHERLDRSRPVLDIGAGQGRNALFLAREGYSVHALDASEVGLGAVAAVAEQEKLPLQTFTATFESFEPAVDSYGGILAYGLIPDLSWDSISVLRERLETWTNETSIIWLTGHTTQDPAFNKVQKEWTALGDNSFETPSGGLRTYLEPGQILTLFEDHIILHHREGLGTEHRHGEGPVERHGTFGAVLRPPPVRP